MFCGSLAKEGVEQLRHWRDGVLRLKCPTYVLQQRVSIAATLVFIALVGRMMLRVPDGRNTLNCFASGDLEQRSFPETFQNLLGPFNQRFGGGWNATSCAAVIGIFSYAQGERRRALLRSSYNTFFPRNIALQVSDCSLDKVLVRFVIGLKKEETKSAKLEIEDFKFGDIIYLDMEENINEGKTYTYFKHVGDRLTEFNYPVIVGKVEEDSFLNIPNFLFRLAVAPWNGKSLAIGRSCYPTNYFCGMGYFITQNLVTWIRQSPWVANNTIGKEDELFTSWLEYANEHETAVIQPPRAIFWDNMMHKLPPSKDTTNCSILDYGWAVSDNSILTHLLKSDAELKTVVECYFSNSRNKLQALYRRLYW